MTDEGQQSDPAAEDTIFDPPHPELIIGLVTPIGTNTADLALRVRGRLSEWGYDSEIIHISDGLNTTAPEGEHEDDRIVRLIDAGNAWCKERKSPFGLGQLFCTGIRDRRIDLHKRCGNENVSDEVLGANPLPKVAYILHSLKRPGEVELLRATYGSLFFLLGCQTPLEERIETLSRRLESRLFWDEEQRRNRALELINRDEEESGDYGQNIRKTYPLADVFVPPHGDPDRAIRLLFGDHTLAPDPGEYAMFSAQAASARSLTASRRVGAAIMVGDSVVATGWNDVPLVAGEEPDAARGIDTSEQRKRELAVSTVRRLREKNWLNKDRTDLVDDPTKVAVLVETIMDDLDDSPITNVIEFQRAVHAEMWAILDAARRGVALSGAVMYGNTWPCHLCWKHIFSVGIETMYYIDSYPKSQATQMYARTSSKLQPFVGVAPRQFLRLFANRSLARADRIGRIPPTRTSAARPLVDTGATARYLNAEAIVIDYRNDEEERS